jgi:serine/threonine-protein kinase HipA
VKRKIQICLGDAALKLGMLRYDQLGSRESSAFEYDNAWLEKPDRFTIDPALQLVQGSQFHRNRSARDG